MGSRKWGQNTDFPNISNNCVLTLVLGELQEFWPN